MKRKSYEYYAKFDYADDGITVTFPELPGYITCGHNTEEATQMAKEALVLYLEDMPEKNIPKPTITYANLLVPHEKNSSDQRCFTDI
ncbi:type II toxin-antitoxin system HicB family antitoxin [Paenibacillus sp. FSL P2-0089]|uniref:type II toxin-antitoxin system HicB family antitoxin n=1 Tax=Paenibacillus sp. FSL P2-0089 TaxID=2954526 RepID=UPI00315A9B68